MSEVRTAELLAELLSARLLRPARSWVDEACGEVARGVDSTRLGALLSAASRHVPKGPLDPREAEVRRAGELLADWTPERWTLLEAARVAILLAQPDLAGPAAAAALEDAVRYADLGELCALYRSLAHWPAAERFRRRAGEGARSNMRAVFEATCCDTPYPALYFDDVAWRQAVIKCLFVEAPLWRLRGLDRRIDGELARMALDLADERRAAGRRVAPELLACLGHAGGARGMAWIERLLAEGDLEQRRAAGLACVRAGAPERLRARLAEEPDAGVRRAFEAALAGRAASFDFASPPLQGAARAALAD